MQTTIRFPDVNVGQIQFAGSNKTNTYQELIRNKNTYQELIRVPTCIAIEFVTSAPNDKDKIRSSSARK
jgi:hypothetical protein